MDNRDNFNETILKTNQCSSWSELIQLPSSDAVVISYVVNNYVFFLLKKKSNQTVQSCFYGGGVLIKTLFSPHVKSLSLVSEYRLISLIMITLRHISTLLLLLLLSFLFVGMQGGKNVKSSSSKMQRILREDVVSGNQLKMFLYIKNIGLAYFVTLSYETALFILH